MSFTDDLITILEDAGVGTFGVTIYASSKAAFPRFLPSGVKALLSIHTTGGSGPERVQNTLKRPYRRPSAEIVARAPIYVDAEELAQVALDALMPIRNSYIGSGQVFYREINPLNEPHDIGLDDSGRARVAFNVMAVYRP